MEYTKGTFKDGTTGWKAIPYPKERQLGFSTHEIHFSDDGECVAEVVHGEANAKLMAVAPELLEALEEIASLSDSPEDSQSLFAIWKTANDAIKKAIA